MTMNEEFSRLLACLPAAPSYTYDWSSLYATPLAPLLRAMADIPQNPSWHGEGDVLQHTILVCQNLCSLPEFRVLSSRRQQILALAALLHDIGKISCTKFENGVPVSPGHSRAGAQKARSILWQEFGLCGTQKTIAFRESVCLLIARHMLPVHLIDRENAALLSMQLAANGELLPDFTLDMLFILSKADVLGRIAPDTHELLDALALGCDLVKETGCLEKPYSFPSAHTQHAYLSGRSVWPDQPLFDDRWGEVILLCGLPGTGKDTFIRTQYPDMPVISLDDIRREMGVDPTDNQGSVIQAARAQARVHLRAHQSFIWNATSLTETLRQNQTQLYENYGAAVRIIYLETPWLENLRRNQERKYAVPENVISHMLSKLAPPLRAEARHVQWTPW